MLRYAANMQGRAERRYYVHIMASSSGTLYTGITNNVRRRCAQHKAGEGSEFTHKYVVDRLAYFERFRYVLNAIAREKEIKGWRRSKKVSLIVSMNPHWRDLSRDFGREFEPAAAGRDASLRSA